MCVAISILLLPEQGQFLNLFEEIKIQVQCTAPCPTFHIKHLLELPDVDGCEEGAAGDTLLQTEIPHPFLQAEN